MRRKTPNLLAMCLLSLWLFPGVTRAQSGFDTIYDFSHAVPIPYSSISSGIRSVYADSQSIFVGGNTFMDSTLASADPNNSCFFLGAFDYSGNLRWEKKLSFQPPYKATKTFLFHSIGKVSSNKYVIGAQGWDFTTMSGGGYLLPRSFLYFFNGNGDSLGFSPMPYHDRPENVFFLYALMADKQKNIIVTGKYSNSTLSPDTIGTWLAKFDSSGRFLWRKVILNQTNSNGWAEAYKIINSNDGLHYVLGGRANHPSSTWFAVWKTDTAGNVIWQKNIPKATTTFNPQMLGDQYFDIIPAVNGSGYYFLAVDQKPTQLPNLPKSVTTIYYCGKLDESGNVVWAKTYQLDDRHFEQIYGLDQRPNGDLLFMGHSSGYSTPKALASSGPTLFCTDSLGNLKWFEITKRYPCPYGQATWSISLNPYGGIVRGGANTRFSCDTLGTIAWLILSDSFGRGSAIIDTTTYPVIVREVTQDDTPATITIRNESALQIKIYPNPTRDKVTISLAGLQENPPQVNIQLYDYTGRLLQQQNMKTPTTTLDLSNYAPGIYFIRLRYGDKDIGGGKIVKQ